MTTCQDCEEYKATMRCTNCDEELCDECADSDHDCMEAELEGYEEKLRARMFKPIKKQR